MCLLRLTLNCQKGPFLISDSWSQAVTSESAYNTGPVYARGQIDVMLWMSLMKDLM